MSKHPIVHIELSAEDRVAAGKFYSEVFGWKVIQDENLNYALFESQEGFGGGFNPVGENFPAGTIVPYLQSEDIEVDLARIEGHGGKVLVPKTEIPGVGWFAWFSDPSGNKLGLYTGMGN